MYIYMLENGVNRQRRMLWIRGSINRLYTYVGILKVRGLLKLFCDRQKK